MINKVIIIGGGIAGLACAISLKHKGFTVQVYEQAQDYKPMGGDIALWPNGLHVLHELGLYHEVVNRSGGYPKIMMGTEQGQLIAELPITVYHQIAPYDLMNICRYELQKILVNALGAEHIIFSKQCMKIEESATQVTVHFQDGSCARADILIGADGSNSVVRHYVEPEGQLNYAGYVSLGGINVLPYHINYHLVFGKYVSIVFPVGGNRQAFFFAAQHADCDIEQSYPAITDQFDLLRHHTPLVDGMLCTLEQSIQLMGEDNYFFVKNYYLQPLEKWSKGRVVLMGDAAHLMGSILGCSASMVLEGGNLLVNCLQQYKQDYATAFQVYQSLHQPRVNNLLALERKFTDKFFNNKLLEYSSFNDELIACLTLFAPTLAKGLKL